MPWSSSSGRLTTAKKAICIPSIMPTKDMRKMKIRTETIGGMDPLPHMAVLPSNNADTVTA
eukprot:CAMPEP_0198145728 /NCGR_PEP_ID=MMETSP1443-20131203/24891_1 /TAXON_ID=186043 /ORGANISM="Entomoneis sp., Strain CCMP2396" /LENGTH=60 /DNA_ID=CAMNT_0043809433 /DNA_START=44 /DNA_END=222 /DNA_ORIENTATION=-